MHRQALKVMRCGVVVHLFSPFHSSLGHKYGYRKFINRMLEGRFALRNEQVCWMSDLLIGQVMELMGTDWVSVTGFMMDHKKREVKKPSPRILS